MNIQKSNSNFIFRRTSTEITVLFGLWQKLSLQKSPLLLGAKNFATWLLRRICKLERRPERSMAVYSVFVVAYWQFLLQSRLSDSIEQYNEPPRLQGTSQNRILWFKSTRRMPGTMVGEMVQNSQSLYSFTFNALIDIHEYI